MRQLSLCILDYLPDSSVIYTVESGLWFFILSFLTLVSHLLPLGRDTGGRVMLHSGLISSNSTHAFSSLFPNLHFSSLWVPGSPQALVISCLVDSSFPSSKIPTAAHCPDPLPHQWPFSPPLPLPPFPFPLHWGPGWPCSFLGCGGGMILMSWDHQGGGRELLGRGGRGQHCQLEQTNRWEGRHGGGAIC